MASTWAPVRPGAARCPGRRRHPRRGRGPRHQGQCRAGVAHPYAAVSDVLNVAEGRLPRRLTIAARTKPDFSAPRKPWRPMARRSRITPWRNGRRCQLTSPPTRALIRMPEFVLTGTFSVAPTEGPRWRSTPAPRYRRHGGCRGPRDDPADGLYVGRSSSTTSPMAQSMLLVWPRTCPGLPGTTCQQRHRAVAFRGLDPQGHALHLRPGLMPGRLVSRGRGRQPSSNPALDRLHPLGLPSTTSIRRPPGGPDLIGVARPATRRGDGGPSAGRWGGWRQGAAGTNKTISGVNRFPIVLFGYGRFRRCRQNSGACPR